MLAVADLAKRSTRIMKHILNEKEKGLRSEGIKKQHLAFHLEKQNKTMPGVVIMNKWQWKECRQAAAGRQSVNPVRGCSLCPEVGLRNFYSSSLLLRQSDSHCFVTLLYQPPNWDGEIKGLVMQVT